MTSCPCCSRPLLRHIRHQEIYWFCRSCWQDMPVLSEDKHTALPAVYLADFPSKLTGKKEKNNIFSLNKREAITGWIGAQN
jgi:ribosomal protein L37AE/L43A